MSIKVNLYKFSFKHQTSKNSIRRCCRNPTQFPHIGVHDIIVVFQVLLNLVPAECDFIQLSIALISLLVLMASMSDALIAESINSSINTVDSPALLEGVDGRIIFLLAVMDDGFHGEPGKGRIRLGEQQRMPQAAHTPISIGKGVDYFQLVPKYVTANIWIYFIIYCASFQ